MTCASDGRDHAVTEHAQQEGRDSGRYQSLCARTILPRAMMSPPGPTCAACAQESEQRAAATRERTGCGRLAGLIHGRLAAWKLRWPSGG
jgi:hypothetical protein